jgi:hypothetical protein
MTAALAPGGYWVAMVLDALWKGASVDWGRALRELGVVMAFGLPIAGLVALAWGWPVLLVLRRVGLLRAWSVTAAGAAGGAIVSLAFAANPNDGLFEVRMPIALAMALGALAGGTCWSLRDRRS